MNTKHKTYKKREIVSKRQIYRRVANEMQLVKSKIEIQFEDRNIETSSYNKLPTLLSKKECVTNTNFNLESVTKMSSTRLPKPSYITNENFLVHIFEPNEVFDLEDDENDKSILNLQNSNSISENSLIKNLRQWATTGHNIASF